MLGINLVSSSVIIRHNQYASGRSIASMMWLLLLLSGIESNPGPTKYPCGECNKPVYYGRSILCDNCNKWYHKSCIEMYTIVYDCYTENSKLEWECCNCAIKNISFSLFNHPVDSDHLLSSPICSSSPNITTKKAKQLRIMTINFQSVWGKKEELELALVENNIDVVIGCKTYLDPCIHDSEFLPLNYTCFWRDRKDGWGGVIIIIKNELIAEQITSSMLSEIVAVKITTHRQPIIIAACCRPPKNSISNLKQLTTELQDLLLQYKNLPFWVGGDFNLPDIDWSLKSIVKHQYCKEINEVFLESLDVINAEQIVDFPTRGGNTLDLLLTNRVSLLNKCCDIPGFGDHQSAILADIECHPKKQKPISRKIYL